MEIYANANIASWQGAARLRSITLAPIFAVDATGVSAAKADLDVLGGVSAFTGAGQVTPKAMRTHNSTPRPGSPPRGSTPLT